MASSRASLAQHHRPEGAGTMSETTRYPAGTFVWNCPLGTCEWAYAQPPPGTVTAETPSAPVGYAATLDEAISQGVFATMTDWLSGADKVLEAHLETHSLLEWVREVTDLRSDLNHLLAAATVYVEAFEPDEMMTLPGKLALQEVEAVLEKHGKRY